jgi:hypothetical protein
LHAFMEGAYKWKEVLEMWKVSIRWGHKCWWWRGNVGNCIHATSLHVAYTLVEMIVYFEENFYAHEMEQTRWTWEQ